MSDYPSWLITTLTGKTIGVDGYIDINEDGVVRIYQMKHEVKDGMLQEYEETQFLAALINLECIVRDDEEELEE